MISKYSTPQKPSTIILSVFLGMLQACALEIHINSGKENQKDFSVLTLRHTRPFKCKENINVYNEISSIDCTIDETPINNFIPTNTLYFDFKTQVVDNKFHIIIAPKHKIKLFSTFIDLKTNAPIPKERPDKSRQWQIVGYASTIPFLSQKSTNGLNFPINIPSLNNLYVQQLDINLRPLHYEEGVDFDRLKEIRALFGQKKYADVLNDCTKSLKSFPKSIFKKDFLFYQIKSLTHFPTKDNLNTIIALCLDWIKDYPSDKAIPDVIYILANTYAQIFLNDEAYYYYKRIINEYGDTDWSALAKMQLAKNFASEGLFKINASLFVDAYKSARTKEVANKIAIEWAKYCLAQNDKQKAKDLIDLVLKDNPIYFVENLQNTLSLLQSLASYDLPDLAADIGSYLIDKLPQNDEELEKLINQTAQWYQEAGNMKKAEEYNSIFLKKYPNSKDYQSVMARNDRLLFNFSNTEDPEKKIKILDQIIARYPDSKESETAYQIKAETLFGLKRYQDILSIQDHLKQSPIIAKAKNAIILEYLSENNCKEIPPLLQGSQTQLFDEKEKIQLFDCLYSTKHYREAKKILDEVSLENKNTQDKLPWLYRTAKTLYHLGDFVTSRFAAEDTTSIAHALQISEYYDVGFYLFDDLANLGLEEKAQKTAAILAKEFPDDERMLKVWRTLLEWAEKKKDNNAVEIYAKDILTLQKKTKNYDDSPYVNLVLIDALTANGKYQESKTIIEDLLTQKLKPEERQKILYIQGALLKSIGEDGTKAFQECNQIDVLSNWRLLCQKSLDLMKEKIQKK